MFIVKKGRETTCKLTKQEENQAYAKEILKSTYRSLSQKNYVFKCKPD